MNTKTVLTALSLVLAVTLQGCATAVSIVDVTASTAIYTGKAVVGLVTPNQNKP
jgi:hypothetical protein